MEVNRKPFQGVTNIIRFNWHFYLIAGAVLMALFFVGEALPNPLQTMAHGLSILTILTISLSLLVSCYVYDLSGLYQLNWLPDADNKTVLNMNAGFDETSDLIKNKFPDTELTVCDFYNPERHTEISIERARKAYPPAPETIRVSTDQLPFPDNTFDYTLAILSAHEIRDKNERVRFFNELHRVTKSSGQILVTEHLQDLTNFLAYTIGFFHFHKRNDWLDTFKQSKLTLRHELKTTPFITTFILDTHGDSL